ncbi:MAG: cadherin-like beta sandwich domain-containing protein [Spirochaetaceae bacterium]|nr:cadherin-like beta sandwich domain-containing protein [Spirochaetaceae bacterium]
MVTVEFTPEADKTTAFLSGLYASNGVISPDFGKNTFDYTIAVPFDAEGFSISAQAENPYLEPELRQVSPASGVKELDDNLALTEGLNEYTITVTSQYKSAAKTYRIKAVKLPDLSLKTFKVKKGVDGFERDLAPLDTQTVYVAYKDGLTIEASPNDSGATPSQSPAAIPTLSEYINVPTAVTVTVRKPLSGVEPSLTSKGYTLNLCYVADTDLTPMAEGGYTNFIPAEGGNGYYEVHTFFASGALSFLDKSTASIKADYLIVAGGGGVGGGSGSNNYEGGGGAGGLLYTTGATLPLQNGSAAVVVGAGGKGNGSQAQGQNGGPSAIGNISVPGGGGGGGCNNTTNNNTNGNSGGSGGGGGTGVSTAYGTGGQGSNGNSGIKGNKGGNGANGGSVDSGGGGGGAGGAGTNGNSNGNVVAGGAPWNASNAGASWISTVTGKNEFSRGGNSGGKNGPTGGKAGVNYGDGGSGGNNSSRQGAAGHIGIVVIRLQRPGN